MYSFQRRKLNKLKDSIEKNGLLQPIVVKKQCADIIFIAGERFRAFELLGKNYTGYCKEMS